MARGGFNPAVLELPDAASPAPHEPRRPAIAAAAAVAGGVLLDRFGAPPVALMLGVGAGCLVLAVLAPRVRRAAALGLLVAAGAANHHAAWRAVSATDVSRRVTDERLLVRLTATLAGAPRGYEAADRPGWEDPRRTVCDLDCERLDGDAGPVACTGSVRLYATGSLPDLAAGDRVRVTGWLSPVAGPTNPGQWDRRASLRRDGVRCQVRADAATVELVRRGWNLSAPLAALRSRCARTLEDVLPDRAVPAAKALLLGDRTDLTREDRRRFVASGTMHLLAISGLHVGILAAFAAAVCRLIGLPPLATAVGCVLTVGAFALLAESRPPVLRAVLFVSAAALSLAARRRVDVLNALCAAAAVVLAVTPAALFEVGTQLSFLAVAGLEWGRRVLPNRPRWWPAGPAEVGAGLYEGYRVTAGIWLFTGPLVAAAFGVLSPVGYLLNVVLLPPFGVVLGFGFVTLAAALVWPLSAWMPGLPFGAGLVALLWVVDAAAALPGGHAAVAAPPGWWLAGWYVGLLGSLLLPVRAVRAAAGRAAIAAAILGWAAFGWFAPAAVSASNLPAGAVRVTVLDVGHGSASLVELPDGSTLLYDCGSLSGGDRAADAVANALRARGRTRLNEVVISHADADHFNGLPGLLETVPVGGVTVGPRFAASGQADALAAVDAARTAGVPIARVAAGDRRTAGGATLTALHPPAALGGEASDNDRSVVILLEHAGRRALFTGDLEGPRQTTLVKHYVTERGPGVDLLLAPHHGGKRANPASLAAALRPRVVAVSGAQHADPAFLRASYPGADLFLTGERGAVTVTIAADGGVTVEGFLPE